MAFSIILTSHGYFAQEALRSVEMIIGTPQNQIAAVSVTEGKDYETCLEELRQVYESLNKENGVLILADIYGGTPSKIAMHLAMEAENIQVYSGFNLPLLMEICFMRELDFESLDQALTPLAEASWINISRKLKEMNENGNQVDSY